MYFSCLSFRSILFEIKVLHLLMSVNLCIERIVKSDALVSNAKGKNQSSLTKKSLYRMDMLPWIIVSCLLVSVVTGVVTVILVKGME